MTNTDSVQRHDAPSARDILRSTAIAAIVALALHVTIILPAEYGKDPTRIGKLLGLKEMGEIKMALAKEEAAQAPREAATATPVVPAPATAPVPVPAAATTIVDSTGKSDVTEVTLQPNEGKEIKLAMRKDARVTYSWTTAGGPVNYDTHADAPTIKYHGYAKGSGVASNEGVLTAAFDGEHGWFWRNRTKGPVTVTLRTRGNYQELMRK